ncbi:hypothetical protein [Myroides pelagicus]|uniref:HipA domain-containing protein n=1 Tax=Myroides pelagicus TaxID=270914 RepID=A0A7K1GPH8_9FLAO|nr:hypothetical protein [Myroides pelagicus]MTH30751.1 hypothetical protein [Myroides pelagicus]
MSEWWCTFIGIYIIYDHQKDKWNLAPAYDLTYPLDALMNYIKVSRAMAINGKRTDINKQDLLEIAERYSIKNAKGIINEVIKATEDFKALCEIQNLPEKVIQKIYTEFNLLT